MGHGQAGQAELLHRLDADHRRRLEVAHEDLVDGGQGDAGVAEGQEPGVTGEVDPGPIPVAAEAHHADARDGGAFDPHGVAPSSVGAAAPAERGANRMITTSLPSSSVRSVSRSNTIAMPMAKSPAWPSSRACTRGPSSRST